MKLEEIKQRLCYYDRRNPDNDLDFLEMDEDEINKAKSNCACDNCFYGRDRLANYILTLLETNEKLSVSLT